MHAVRIRSGLALCGAFFLLLSVPRCSREQAPVSRVDAIPPATRILAPAAGSEVADTVQVVAAATDASGVHCVTLLADSLACGTRYGPPWVLTWDASGLPDGSRHTLHVEALDRAGNRALSEAVPLTVRRNSSPRVRLLFPREQEYLSLDDSCAAWRCAASDAEEGDLHGEAIDWWLDGLPLGLTGEVIAAPALTPGTHGLAVRARDRWGRAGTAACEVIAFHYPVGDDPAAVVETMLLALRAGAPARAAACLAEGYRGLGPGPAQAPSFTRASEEQALLALFARSGRAQLRIAATPGRAESFALCGSGMAQIELREFDVRLDAGCSSEESGEVLARSSSPTGEGTRDGAAGARIWRVAHSGARIHLRRDPPGQGPWRIHAWWDLHGARPEVEDALSWSALKHAAREGALCE